MLKNAAYFVAGATTWTVICAIIVKFVYDNDTIDNSLESFKN